MRIFFRILAALVLIAAVVGVGVYAYSLGTTQALAQQVPVTTGGTAPVPYFYPMHPFFMFGWGPLGCLVPLFLLFLVLGSFRALFWHGPMGVCEAQPFAAGTIAVAKAMAQVMGGNTVVGGIDTGAAVHRAGVASNITHISTGGSASLEFIEGNKLPGLAALES